MQKVVQTVKNATIFLSFHKVSPGSYLYPYNFSNHVKNTENRMGDKFLPCQTPIWHGKKGRDFIDRQYPRLDISVHVFNKIEAFIIYVNIKKRLP